MSADPAARPTGKPACPSTFTPPYPPGQPRRTWRCDGESGHRGVYHGGPADDDPGNRAAWPGNQADTQHPGEATVVSLRHMRLYVSALVEQRDQILAAWQHYACAAEALLEQAGRHGTLSHAAVSAVFDAIPAWARPASPGNGDPAQVPETVSRRGPERHTADGGQP